MGCVCVWGGGVLKNTTSTGIVKFPRSPEEVRDSDHRAKQAGSITFSVTQLNLSWSPTPPGGGNVPLSLDAGVASKF